MYCNNKGSLTSINFSAKFPTLYAQKQLNHSLCRSFFRSTLLKKLLKNDIYRYLNHIIYLISTILKMGLNNYNLFHIMMFNVTLIFFVLCLTLVGVSGWDAGAKLNPGMYWTGVAFGVLSGLAAINWCIISLANSCPVD
jgi:hypothetical protein